MWLIIVHRSYQQGYVRDINTIPGEAEVTDSETRTMTDTELSAKLSKVKTSEAEGEEEEADVEELLCWSADLDFDQ